MGCQRRCDDHWLRRRRAHVKPPVVPQGSVRREDCARQPRAQHVASPGIPTHDATGAADADAGANQQENGREGEAQVARKELLQWIGVCVLIASINFRGRRCNLWEGGGAPSKYLPSYNLCATGMSCNCFDDICYAVRWSRQPPEKPHGMSSEQYHWIWLTTLSPTSTSIARRCSSPVAISRLTSP